MLRRQASERTAQTLFWKNAVQIDVLRLLCMRKRQSGGILNLGDAAWRENLHMRVTSQAGSLKAKRAQQEQPTWNLEVMSKCFFMSVPNTWLTDTSLSWVYVSVWPASTACMKMQLS